MSDIQASSVKASLRCKASAWHNNCALNSLTHFIYSQLETEQLQHLYGSNHEYLSLLKSFQDYYELPKMPSWAEIKILLQSFDAPHDKEVILAPVLRKHLGKILLRESAKLWEMDASMAFSTYLDLGEITDAALSIFNANSEFFVQLKHNYEQEKEALLLSPLPFSEEETIAATQLILDHNRGKIPGGPRYLPIDEQNIQNKITFTRKNNLLDKYLNQAKTYWLQSGSRSYADYVGNLKNSVMVSADQLQFLCQKLKISALVHMPDGSILRPSESFVWEMILFNNGRHWEYQEPTGDMEKQAQHNAYYLVENVESKFNSHNPDNPPLSENIIAHIRNWWLESGPLVAEPEPEPESRWTSTINWVFGKPKRKRPEENKEESKAAEQEEQKEQKQEEEKAEASDYDAPVKKQKIGS